MQALAARRGFLLSSRQTFFRCASTESSQKPQQGQSAKPRASKQLPDVDIGGVKFSNVETAWKAEQFESKRKSQHQQQQQQPRRRSSSGAQQDDSSINSLLQESSPAPGDVAFTVPTKRKQQRQRPNVQTGKKSPPSQQQQQSQKKKQAGRPRQVGPVFGADAQPDLAMPSSVKDTGRYLSQNSALLSSLRQVPKAPLGSYARAQVTRVAGGDGLGERVLGQNGSFTAKQKAALLEGIQRLSPQPEAQAQAGAKQA